MLIIKTFGDEKGQGQKAKGDKEFKLVEPNGDLEKVERWIQIIRRIS